MIAFRWLRGRETTGEKILVYSEQDYAFGQAMLTLRTPSG